MTRRIHKKSQKAFAASRIESTVAKTRRDLVNMKRIIDQAKREEMSGQGGRGKSAPMFIDQPSSLTGGGSESYFNTIISAKAKQFGKAFGPSKGATELSLEMYKKFKKNIDTDSKEDSDYMTLAASIGVVAAYNAAQAVQADATKLAQLPAALKEYQDEIVRPAVGSTARGTITSALKKMLAHSSISGDISDLAELCFPINPNFIAIKDKARKEVGVKRDSKGEFLKKREVQAAYRKYILTNKPKDSVALPKQINEQATVTALVKWFDSNPQYSLDDTFAYYKDAYNSSTSKTKIKSQDLFQKGLIVLKKSFDHFIDTLRDSLYIDSIGEAEELRKDFFELVHAGATPDEYLLAELLLVQATTNTAIEDLDALGYAVFHDDVDLINVLATNETTANDLSPVDYDIWKAFRKIRFLYDDLKGIVLNSSEINEIKKSLEKAIADIDALPDTIYDDSFKSFLNEKLIEELHFLCEDFNEAFKSNASPTGTGSEDCGHDDIREKVVKVLNALFVGYLKDDRDGLKAMPTSDVNNFIGMTSPNVEFTDSVIEQLADGSRLSFYDEGTNEFGTKEVDYALRDLLKEFKTKAKSTSVYQDMEMAVVRIAENLQASFDAALFEAEANPDVKVLRNNPSMSTMHKVGVGALGFGLAHVGSSLSQSFMNKGGTSSGGKFYAAEYLAPALVLGAGAYHTFGKDKNKELGTSLMVGAGLSVALRAIAHSMKNSTSPLVKYFFNPIVAMPASWLGDNTFKKSLPAIQSGTQVTQNDNGSLTIDGVIYALFNNSDPSNLVYKSADGSKYYAASTKKVLTEAEAKVAFPSLFQQVAPVVSQPTTIESDTQVPQQQVPAPIPQLPTYVLNGVVARHLQDGTVEINGTIYTPTSMGTNEVVVYQNLFDPFSALKYYIECVYLIGENDPLGMSFASEENLQATFGAVEQQLLTIFGDATQQVQPQPKSGFGRFVQKGNGKAAAPSYQYTPAEIEKYEIARMAQEQSAPIYAGAAGMGKYVSTPRHDPLYTYNPPTELDYDGLDQLSPAASMDEIEDAIEILREADPLSSSEMAKEGLSGYVNDMIVRTTPQMARKLQKTKLGKKIKDSSKSDGSVLVKIEAATSGEGPIEKEYNPSLPSGDFGPEQIDFAPSIEIPTSGVFGRGAFATRLPNIDGSQDF